MIKIITVCDSFKHFDESIKEYKKRLSKQVQIIKLKPAKKLNQEEIKKQETLSIIEKLDKINSFKILLSLEWKEMSTIEFSNFIDYKLQNYNEIVFIIWWVYGLDNIIKKFVDFELSLSKMTFTHIETVAILLEQIYRIWTIKQGKSYHY